MHAKERPAAERAASVFGSLLPPAISRITNESITGTSAAPESTPPLPESDSKPQAPQPSCIVTPEVSESRDESSSSVETGFHEVAAMDVQTHEHETQSSTPQIMSAEADISVQESSKENATENGHGEEEQSERDDIIHKEVLPNEQMEEKSAGQLTKAPEPVEVESNVDHGNGINGLHYGVPVENDAVDNAVPELAKDLSNSDIGPQFSAPTLETADGTHAAETDLSQPKVASESRPLVLDTSVQGGDKMEKELKMMEAALLGAARQAQVSHQPTLESLSRFIYILGDYEY